MSVFFIVDVLSIDRVESEHAGQGSVSDATGISPATTMISLTYTAKTTTMSAMMMALMLIVVIEAYRSGPHIDKHPDVCESMSPISGHHAEPMSSPPPFQIRSLTTNNCYKVGEPVTSVYKTALSCCKQTALCLTQYRYCAYFAAIGPIYDIQFLFHKGSAKKIKTVTKM